MELYQFAFQIIALIAHVALKVIFQSKNKN
jgi:hypothetical protein